MHLDARSWFSFHDGVASPAELCAHAAELGFDTLGIADVDGCYGLIHHYQAALKCGLHPVLGLALTDPRPVVGRTAVSAIGSGKQYAEDVGGGPRPPQDRRVGDPAPPGVGARRDAPAAGGGGPGPPLSGAARAPPGGGGARPAPTAEDPVAPKEPAGRMDHRRDADATAGEPGWSAAAATVYALNRDGYSQLCALASSRQLEPRFNLARELTRGADRCVVVTDRAELLAALTPHLGPRRLFVRLDPDLGPAYQARQLRQARLAQQYRLELCALTDVRFVRPQDQAVHHMLRAIGGNGTLHTASGVRPRNHYLAAPTELSGYYYNYPQALTTARRIAEACQVEFELGRWSFPPYEPPGGPPFTPREAAGALKRLCERGLAWRYGAGKAGPAQRTRLAMELKVIEDLGYTSYFLAVYDLTREARRRRIPFLGRGSAANSLVSFLLGFTPVDPLRYHMYFERFLNPERKSPPDIDLDFNWKRRDEIVEYVYDRWGATRVAMISTHVTFQAKSALREVAKVFGLSDREISTVSRFLPSIGAGGLPNAQRDFPELKGVDLASEPYCHVLPLATRLAGRPRHLGIHCGGIVIAPTRMTDYTALQRAAKGLVVTQYDMNPVEDVGLIKIDLLGNRSLGVLADVLKSLGSAPVPGGDSSVGADLVSARNGDPVGARRDAPAGGTCAAPTIDLHYETVAQDPATVALIREGRTMACFYIESPGMRQLLRRLRTQTFLDLTAASSVIRPGVAESGMMQEYIRRVRGEAERQPTHPLMRQLLPETHGVMIYQEDVIRVGHELAGLSLAEADLLRRAMSGKLRSHGAMNEVRERFIAGCEGNGLDVASALAIWRQIASFAGYSFCKAHSASFATLSFQLAYLKAHHPAHLMAAVLSNGGGFYGPRAYLSECERLGLSILPPDVNHSRLEYTAEWTGRVSGTLVPQVGGGPRPPHERRVGDPAPPDHRRDACATTSEPDAVRVGLSALKGVGAALLSRIVVERERRGPFRDLPGFIRRTRPGQTELGVLIRAGALDSLGLTRPELMWLTQLEHRAAIRAAGEKLRDAPARGRAGARTAPDRRAGAATPPLPLDDAARIADFRERIGSGLDDYDELKLCLLELEHLGMLVSRHPLSLVQHRVAGVVAACDLPRHRGRWVRLLGWCIATKRVDLTRRQNVRDLLELQADHPDRPEPAAGGDDLDERLDTASDLGIILPGTTHRPQQYASGPARAMKFMSMEDMTGTFEVTLFADAYARFAPLTRYAGPFLVTGKVEEHFDTYTVNATGLELLPLDGSLREAGPQGQSSGAQERSNAVRTAGRAKG